MPWDKSLYPRSWPLIAGTLKAIADYRCAHCGRPCRRPGEDDEDLLARLAEEPDQSWLRDAQVESYDDETGEWGVVPHKLNRYQIGVAHLDHNPANCDPSNLLPLCTVCHCRMDLRAMPTKRQLKAERLGQMRLEGL